jgi:hypothetical protein
MGNRYSNQEETKLKSKAYRFVDINELIKDVSKIKIEKKYNEVEYIIKQFPICTNVEYMSNQILMFDYSVRTYYHIGNMTINGIVNINPSKVEKKKFGDIKIGLTKQQYEFLKN